MAKFKVGDGYGIDYECPECGSDIELGQNYCPECGESLEWVEDYSEWCNEESE